MRCLILSHKHSLKLDESATVLNLARRVYMIKRLMFILLVAFMFAAGAVVSMADDDPASIKNFMAEKKEGPIRLH